MYGKTLVRCMSVCVVALMLFSPISVAVSMKSPEGTVSLVDSTIVSHKTIAGDAGQSGAADNADTNTAGAPAADSAAGTKNTAPVVSKSATDAYFDDHLGSDGSTGIFSDVKNQNGKYLFSATDHHGAKMANADGFTGKGVRVGILDNGIDFGNPDITGTQARVGNYNVKNDVFIKKEGTVDVNTTKLSYVDRVPGTLVGGTITVWKDGSLLDPSKYTVTTNGTTIFTYRFI